jgi:6-pyruvoyltetrahydropterin/6-carboxytetrahydropterin synthase
MPVSISKTVHIEVAHRFEQHPIQANRRMHGHSLKITVTSASDNELINGMVMDFETFGAQVETIAGMLDHRYLNEVEGLGAPTLENVAQWLGQRMAIVAPLHTLAVKVERESLGQAAEWQP